MSIVSNQTIASAVRPGNLNARRHFDGLPIDQASYDRLRRIASSLLRRECRTHSLEAEDLLHEVLLRLMKGLRKIPFQDWDHLRRTATVSMRRALVDHARASRATKRGGGEVCVELQANSLVVENHSNEMIEVSQALRRLEQADWRKCRVAELHVLSAFSFDEIARALSVSTRTVKRDWRDARGFLRCELGISRSPSKPPRISQDGRSHCKTKPVLLPNSEAERGLAGQVPRSPNQFPN